MNDKHCIAWDPLPQTVRPSGVAKRTIEGLGASLVMVKVPAGTKAVRHRHPHEQFVEVISGRAGSRLRRVSALSNQDVFHFPADAWHAASFDSDTVLIETSGLNARREVPGLSRQFSSIGGS